MTDILNRNYVTKEMNAFLFNTSQDLKEINNEIDIRYLDACFPFFKGFPLLPHLSHNDGNKIDFSFIYQNSQGLIINKSKSISGYGVFEDPEANEFNQTEFCMKNGYFQYDYPKYFTFGKINKDLDFSINGTKTLITILLRQKDLSKIFIESHLKDRMKLKSDKLRFQGCGSVRHDDHIHVQIKEIN